MATGSVIASQMGFISGVGIRNTSDTTSGFCNWFQQKVGDHYITFVTWDVYVNGTKNSANVATFFTGLPIPVEYVTYMCKGVATETGNVGMFIITDADGEEKGYLKPWHCGNVSGHWFGSAEYIS